MQHEQRYQRQLPPYWGGSCQVRCTRFQASVLNNYFRPAVDPSPLRYGFTSVTSVYLFIEHSTVQFCFDEIVLFKVN